jgi:hypothetical protein
MLFVYIFVGKKRYQRAMMQSVYGMCSYHNKNNEVESRTYQMPLVSCGPGSCDIMDNGIIIIDYHNLSLDKFKPRVGPWNSRGASDLGG